jgi:aspartokinase-like uncharacterized kinase
MNPPIVVKVGGSLLDWPALPARLAGFLDARSTERFVLIAGGGRTTDVIRELDRIHGLGDGPSHSLALRSLDLTAYLLATLVPRSRVVARLDSLAATWTRGRLPIFAPRAFLEDVDAHSPRPLEASWNVTSDAIAARVAVRLGAKELILLKSAHLPDGIDRHGAAELGLVDPIFVEAAHGVPHVVYVNLRGTPIAPMTL